MFYQLQFNRKPVKGVEYLISNKLVENTPSSVAQFLQNTPTLDKVESLSSKNVGCNVLFDTS